MTQPNGFPAQPDDGLEQLGRLAAGNQNLITRPGLLQSMLANNSTPAQASAINQFMTGMNAQRAVLVARQAGAKLTLTNDQTAALDAMGQTYADVQYTHADAVASEVKALAAYGETPVYDAQGNIVAVKQTSSGGGGGWFSSPGSFFHHVTHNAVTNAIGDGWNVVDTTASKAAHSIVTTFEGEGSIPEGGGQENAGVGGLTSNDVAQKLKAVDQQQAAEMTAMGYDPSSIMSILAFEAKGLSHSDTSDLAAGWDNQNPGQFGWDGKTAVLQAEVFAADPSAFIKKMATDPTLTPGDIAARLADPAFAKLIAEVQGRQSSIGNDFAHSIGLDPVTHPKAFAYVSAASDAAASFLIDPVAIAGGLYKAAKVSAIGIDGLNDAEKIRAIMDPTNGSIFAKRVQNTWQGLLDNATAIREGLDAGSDEGKIQAASAMAAARATTPALTDLLPDIMGENQILDKAGTIGAGTPITTMAELTDYLASKNALMRLTRGRAALESGLMPGALSSFSYRWLKGALAGRIAGRSVAINLAREVNVDKTIASTADAVDAITGESKVAQNVSEVNPEILRNPTGAINTADAGTGATPLENAAKDKSAHSLDDELAELSEHGQSSINPPSAIPSTPAGLASATRAKNALPSAEKGDLLLAARQGATPAAQWARLKLMGQRLSSFLPRNNLINLGDPDTAEKIYRFGTQFLTKGDAALYAAMAARGGEGVQKAVIDGIIQQTGHAAGLGTTEAGRTLLEKLPDLNMQRYGHTGNEQILDPRTGITRDAAIFPSQVRDEFWLPNFQTLHRASAKVGIWQNTVGRVFNNSVADTFMDYERMAMLLKPNIAYRNIIEGQGHIALRGLYGDMLRAKAVAGDNLTPRKTILSKAVGALWLDKVGALYKRGLLANANPDEIKYMRDFAESDDFMPTVMGYGQQIPGRAPDPHGVEDADLLTRQGFRIQRFKRTGFGMDDTAGAVGADRYAHALGMRVGQYPELDRAIIDAIQNPTGDISGVTDALKLPTIKPVVDKMIRSSIFDDGAATRSAVSAEQKAQSLDQIARLQVSDMKYLLTGQDGSYLQSVADHIYDKGAAPSTKWISENLEDKVRPKAVLAPQYAPVATNGALGFVRNLLDSGGIGYQHMVENTIKRTTTEPAFLMHYGKARMALKGVEQDMMDAGLSPEAADKAMQDLAVKRAYNATEAMIDDPGLKTQADIVGKNFFMFSRAMQAFIRRWGGLAIENPIALRKGMLALEGMHHAGLIYADANGNENFTYPGSDLAMGAMMRFTDLIPGLGSSVLYPISGGLSGQVNMVAPGVDNPARLSLSPMLNMPMHIVENFFPQDRQTFDQIDRALSGQDAQGKAWYAEMIPGAISKFTAASATDRNSALASAMKGAIMNLAAVDPNGTKGLFPGPDATPQQIDQFIGRLQQQTRNQLFLRAAFGEFAPAPPGLPSETVNGSAPDPLMSAAGVRNLDDEYKSLLNDVGGNRAEATAIFTALHPERSVYTIPTSVSTTSKAYLPDTATAESWINSNMDFINNNKSVAAYFIPQADGPFDLNAYNAQIETGLRQRDTPTEFLNAFRVSAASNEFYASLATKTAAYNQALASGNKQLATQIDTRFNAWEQQFNAMNPLWAAQEASQAVSQQTAKEQIVNLENMLSSSNLPTTVTAIAPQLREMIATYNVQAQWVADHSGNTSADYAMRKQELAGYEAYMSGLIGSNGNLQNIYNGVFKPLNYTVQVTKN